MFIRQILPLIFLFSACSTPPKVYVPVHPFPLPTAAVHEANANDELTLAVVGINDFHGSLLPKERKLPNGSIVKSGGASALAAMVQILEKEMKGHVLIVDAGDEWQGTLESNQVQGSTVVDFFNRLGVKAAAVGNHEFDFTLKTMRERFQKANYPYLAANIYEKKNGKRVDWKNVYPHRMVEVEGVKIGIVGTSTVQTPSTTRYEYVSHLEFKDPEKPVIESSGLLRAEGANLVLLTTHAGTVCDSHPSLKAWSLWSEKELQGQCDREQEVVKLADSLKPGILDGIVSGHTHQITHHFINHIPVVQDEAFNQYFNIIYYTFDRKTHALLPERTRIEGLIPICSEFFENESHCDVRRLAKDQNPKLVPATFHGQKVELNSEIEAWLKPIEDRTEKYRKQIIAFSELPLTHYRDQESPLGNLVADVLQDYGKTDFSLVNSGGIRTSLDAGEISYDAIFRANPFDNYINIVRLKGKDIKLLYQIATSGSHGIASFSGLRLTLIPYSQEVLREDLKGDGKLESWEGKRLVKIETSEGKKIDDNRWYTVATYDFLVNGGDDLLWFMSRVPKKQITRDNCRPTREFVVDYLLKKKRFNTKEHPLVDPEHPRVIFTD